MFTARSIVQLSTIFGLALCLAQLGCNKASTDAASSDPASTDPASTDPASTDPAAAEGSGADVAAVPLVTDDAKTLVFSYVDLRGRINAKSSVAEVPEEVRARVLVVDLAKSPKQRQAHKVAYFADLSARRADGTYPVSVVSRYSAAKGEAAPTVLPTVPKGTVILYSAAWCGYCKKAKRWLTEKNVPFVERDVEKTAGAQDEVSKKLREAGISGGGVPVIDWDGEIIMGFNQGRMETLLAASASSSSSSP